MNCDGYNRVGSTKSGHLTGTVTFLSSPIAFFTGISYNPHQQSEGLVNSLNTIENRTDENGTLFTSIVSCL